MKVIVSRPTRLSSFSNSPVPLTEGRDAGQALVTGRVILRIRWASIRY